MPRQRMESQDAYAGRADSTLQAVTMNSVAGVRETRLLPAEERENLQEKIIRTKTVQQSWHT